MHTYDFKKVDIPQITDIHSLPSPLKKVLYVLWAAKETGDGLFDSLEIVTILREKYEISMNYKTVETALKEAGTKVHRHNLGHKTDFEIMKEGKNYLISSDDVSTKTVKSDTELPKEGRDVNIIEKKHMQHYVLPPTAGDFEKDKRAFINNIWAKSPSPVKKFILLGIVIVAILEMLSIFPTFLPKASIQQTQKKGISVEKEIDKSTRIGEVKGDYVGRDKIIYQTTTTSSSQRHENPVKVEETANLQTHRQSLPVAVQNDDDYFKQLQTSATHLTSDGIHRLVVNAYKNSNHKITISQLSNISMGMYSSDICQTIKTIAPNICNDNNMQTLDSLLGQMYSDDARMASEVLLKTKKI